jgi:ribosomal protein S21
MALEIKRREKESVQSLVRRFSRAVQQSGILVRAREKMYRDREKSEDLKREAALRREELRKKYEKLKKLGKI